MALKRKASNKWPSVLFDSKEKSFIKGKDRPSHYSWASLVCYSGISLILIS